MWSIPWLRGFFPELRSLHAAPLARPDLILGWGAKMSMRVARGLARALDAQAVCVEDGFIRSVGLGRAGAPPLSLVADDRGCYFDARTESQLEVLIGADAQPTPDELAEAEALIALKNAAGLSKYNAGRALDRADLPATTRARVLIIDQTAGDASIAGALASESAFAEIVDRARAAFPRAQLIVKPHPEAAAGRRGGALPAKAIQTADFCVAGDVDMMQLLQAVDVVFTVSSLAGADALFLGKEVHCLGMPWYAGWGATQDAQSIARRTSRRTPRHLFAAGYLRYARYVDPLTGRACSAETAFRRLAAYKTHANRVRGRWVGVNIAPAKRPALRAMLNAPGTTLEFGDIARAQSPATRIVHWASHRNADAVREAARGRTVANLEDGFIRSIGLGSNFVPAASFALDFGGIYYDPTSDSDLEKVLGGASFSGEELAAARRIRELVCASGVTKYNLGGRPLDISAAAGRRVLLVPGQVVDDASVRRGGGGLTTRDVLYAVRKTTPQAFVIYREHPDVLAGNRRGALAPGEAERMADALADQASLGACLAAADEVHTLTSLVGFEALLRGVPVTTYGQPFYAGWGLTTDRSPPDRPRRLSLDELVAGALIRYPLYLDPEARVPVDAETFISRIAAQLAGARLHEVRQNMLGLRHLKALQVMVTERTPRSY